MHLHAAWSCWLHIKLDYLTQVIKLDHLAQMIKLDYPAGNTT